MRRQSKVMWNHLDYTAQMSTIALLRQYLSSVMDSVIKTALEAAIIELEMWSNAPCQSLPAPEMDQIIELPDEDLEDDLDEEEIDIPIKWIH